MSYEKVARQLRVKYGITYAEFASALGVCKNSVVELENPHRNPTPHQLCALQKGFEQVIEARRRELAALERDYRRARLRLLCVQELGEIPEETV